jgi:hypothetical protein
MLKFIANRKVHQKLTETDTSTLLQNVLVFFGCLNNYEIFFTFSRLMNFKTKQKPSVTRRSRSTLNLCVLNFDNIIFGLLWKLSYIKLLVFKAFFMHWTDRKKKIYVSKI